MMKESVEDQNIKDTNNGDGTEKSVSSLNSIAIRYDAVDVARFLGAMLAIALHSYIAAGNESWMGFEIAHVLSRIVVPFLFIASGFFFMEKLKSASEPWPVAKLWLWRLLRLYAAWSLLFLYFDLKDLYNWSPNIGIALLKYIRNFIFVSSHSHLWFMPALIIGTFLLYVGYRLKYLKLFAVIGIVLFLIGAGGNSYYGIIQGFPEIDSVYKMYFQFFKTTRNGLFFGFIYVLMGGISAIYTLELKHKTLIILAMFWFILLHVEAYTLANIGGQADRSIYLSVLPLSLAIFALLRMTPLHLDSERARYLRKSSMGVFFIHVIFIIALESILQNWGIRAGAVAYFLFALICSLAVVSLLMKWNSPVSRVLLD